MALEIVDPNSTEIEHLTSVDVRFSGVHIGGGIYFSANHTPIPGGTRVAIPERGLVGEGEPHDATELDYTLPSDTSQWDLYREDTDNNGQLDYIKTGFDMSMQVGDRLTSTGEFYDGPSIPLLIANDPGDLTGTVTITGYPDAENSLDGQEGTLHQTTGLLTGYTAQSVGGDAGGYYSISGADVVSGMSGGGNFLDYDADGDGSSETYLIAATSRLENGQLQSTAYAPHYADMAATIQSLTGGAARTADDFARMTLLSGQSLLSTNTTVQGQFFHEDIFGGQNGDTLYGAGGDDALFGRAGNDSVEGGEGADTIDGGAGADTLGGGAGADWFAGDGLGGATDVITDFDPSEDVVDLSGFFTTLADAVAAAQESGGGLEIALPGGALPLTGGGTLRLDGVTADALTLTNTNLACFARGTRIAVPGGTRAVEDLEPGDEVLTADGRAVPVVWLGRQSAGAAALVRIGAGALGQGLPLQELRVTADHALLLEGVLVTAGALAGAPGIAWAQVAEATVFHVETAAHEVLLAEGAATESFADAAGRRNFDNYPAYLDRFGADRIVPEMRLPRVTSARLLPRELRLRLGFGAAPAAALRLA